jgi:hypothetical protein
MADNTAFGISQYPGRRILEVPTIKKQQMYGVVIGQIHQLNCYAIDTYIEKSPCTSYTSVTGQQKPKLKTLGSIKMMLFPPLCCKLIIKTKSRLTEFQC